jgi:hypothetical protein
MWWNALLTKQGIEHGNSLADDSNLYRVAV